MNTYLVTWNPEHWKWTRLESDANKTKRGIAVAEPWSCGTTKKILKGDRLFLLKQGAKLPKGIIASGTATSNVYLDKHYNPAKAADGKQAHYVAADWDTVLNYEVEPLLQTSQIDGDGPPQVNWNTMSSGISISLPAAELIEELWAKHIADIRGDDDDLSRLDVIASELIEEGYFDALNIEDERDRQLCEIVQRRGQPEFRSKLIAAYNGRCAITGSDAVDALEASHIMSYTGTKSQHVSNGLLLRADIHTLFDLGLIGIEPLSLEVVLSPKLLNTCLKELCGRKLTLPNDVQLHPSNDAIEQRWKQFKRET